ncbi:hypothetical protein CVT26_013854 [Gymnopilus dilepis]|uniref:ribonuclease H n=1 Tax=Gymnopilus dilepis TaxID=231916 RepID=A0A409VVW7_9AGAR|nr:hypothetical protein CVT26_013854 [Gymnopilus dilepis]
MAGDIAMSVIIRSCSSKPTARVRTTAHTAPTQAPRTSTAHPTCSTAITAQRLPLTPRDATSNRAELSGVIFALWHCNWHNTFDKIVVATDSEYVVKGCTEWANEWVRRGWRTASYAQVKNQDLWEQLLARIEWLQGRNCQVLFWKIPREWNSRADAAAKRAAARADVGCV